MDSFFWALLTALIWGIVPILEKSGLLRVSAITGLFYRCLGIFLGFIILVLFLVRPSEIKSVDVRCALLLILSGFLASFVAQITFYHALKAGEASRVVPVAGSYPLIAFFLGLFFLGESFSMIKLLGIVCVVIGLWALKIG